jgi:hypothetical protein
MPLNNSTNDLRFMVYVAINCHDFFGMLHYSAY